MVSGARCYFFYIRQRMHVHTIYRHRTYILSLTSMQADYYKWCLEFEVDREVVIPSAVVSE